MACEINKEYIETLYDTMDISFVTNTIGEVCRKVSDNTRAVDMKMLKYRVMNLLNTFHSLDILADGTTQVSWIIV